MYSTAAGEMPRSEHREFAELPALFGHLPDISVPADPSQAEQETAREVKLTFAFGGNLKLLVRFDSVPASVLY